MIKVIMTAISLKVLGVDSAASRTHAIAVKTSRYQREQIRGLMLR